MASTARAGAALLGRRDATAAAAVPRLRPGAPAAAVGAAARRAAQTVCRPRQEARRRPLRRAAAAVPGAPDQPGRR